MSKLFPGTNSAGKIDIDAEGQTSHGTVVRADSKPIPPRSTAARGVGCHGFSLLKHTHSLTSGVMTAQVVICIKIKIRSACPWITDDN